MGMEITRVLEKSLHWATTARVVIRSGRAGRVIRGVGSLQVYQPSLLVYDFPRSIDFEPANASHRVKGESAG